jgi:hypothetical protein
MVQLRCTGGEISQLHQHLQIYDRQTVLMCSGEAVLESDSTVQVFGLQRHFNNRPSGPLQTAGLRSKQAALLVSRPTAQCVSLRSNPVPLP